MSGEFRNMFKGIGWLAAGMFLVIMGLSRVAYHSGAGTAAFQLSLLFVFAQFIAAGIAYVQWYRTVNRLAADMYNTEEKRRAAFGHIIRYLVPSVLCSGLIALAAVIAMLIHVIFVGINPVYCYSSVLTGFFTGNVLLFILMRFFGLPDRVLNRY